MVNSIKIRPFFRFLYYILNRSLLVRLEQQYKGNKESELAYPPIFILGPPRCGSTLIFQTVDASFDFGVFTNLHCAFHGAPYLAEYITKRIRPKIIRNFQSNFGNVKGIFGVSECGSWWYRFFSNEPSSHSMASATPENIYALKHSLSKWMNVTNSSVVFKNLFITLRLRAIAKYLPESIFIVIKREEIDIGHSLLEARYKINGSYAKWWSVEPPGADKIKCLPPYEQVIEQIRLIYKTIEAELELGGVATNQRIDINYEDFCANPEGSINQIESFLRANGVKIVRKKGKLPSNFKKRSKIRIDPIMYDRMVNYVNDTKTR